MARLFARCMLKKGVNASIGGMQYLIVRYRRCASTKPYFSTFGPLIRYVDQSEEMYARKGSSGRDATYNILLPISLSAFGFYICLPVSASH